MDGACLLLSEVYHFCASWKETPIQSCNVFFAPKRHFALPKISFSAFLDFVAITLIQKFFESPKCFTWKIVSEDRGSFISPS
jgi:hypothetical protein